MDPWSPEHRRNSKRSFSQMSEVIHPRDNQYQYPPHSPQERFYLPPPSPFIAPPRLPQPSSHNNHAVQRVEMANRPLPMPTLPGEASNTVIDLTEENDVPSSQGRRSSQRAGAPPQLERSDSVTLGGNEVIEIDSDDDDEDEVQFLRENRIAPPPAQAHPRPPVRQYLPVAYRSQLAPAREPFRIERGPGIAAAMEAMRNQGRHPYQAFSNRNFGALFGEIMNGEQIRVPLNLDYGHHPFQEQQRPMKEDHQPPPPARAGFTRSPKEDDVCVCPACDEELVFNPNEVESTSSKKPSAKKAPSKADRAEHPFWVVKECGHLYCNKCYQERQLAKTQKPPTKFPVETKSGKKYVCCAVEDCKSDIGDKRHWVGVFL